MLSVANAKHSPVCLRNGFIVLFYELDNSVRPSVKSFRRRSKTVSNAGLALKATRDWPTEFAFLEDPGFLKALGSRRIRLVDVKDYFMSWFHRHSVPRAPPLLSGTSSVVDDESLVLALPLFLLCLLCRSLAGSTGRRCLFSLSSLVLCLPSLCLPTVDVRPRLSVFPVRRGFR